MFFAKQLKVIPYLFMLPTFVTCVDYFVFFSLVSNVIFIFL